jgi:hypothetical protein
MKTTWRGKREELAGEERVTLLATRACSASPTSCCLFAFFLLTLCTVTVNLTVFKYLVFESPLHFTHDSGVTMSVIVDAHLNYLKIHCLTTKMAHERTIVDRIKNSQQ